MRYTQLSERQRYQISHMLRMGSLQQEIAKEIGVHKSTISREVRRNRSRSGYEFERAHQKAKSRRHGCQASISPEIWLLVGSRLEQEWSPEQISAWLALEKQIKISHEWIYQYILRDKKHGGKMYQHLRCQKKRRKRYGSYDRRGSIPNRRSIEERPESVSERLEIGDWELDTIIGKNYQQALVTIVDRKSRYVLMGKVDQRTSEKVGNLIIELLTPFRTFTKSLTADNGMEFANHRKIEQSLQAPFYFAHPYSSWERGTNENTNGLIRQYIPKSRMMQTVELTEVAEICNKLNHRPRKCLGFRSAHDIFFSHQVALAT